MPETVIPVDAAAPPPHAPFRILSLDGGGSKGFYTLGVLRSVEAQAKKRLHEHFDLIYGTSTGGIIAALLALGNKVDDIHKLYKSHVPSVMSAKDPATKSARLHQLAKEVFTDKRFEDVKTGIGIVATRWDLERPMIFKANVAQAHGRKDTFVPGFGVPISEAIEASCSAYPFFNRKLITTSSGDKVELIDGGYSANNPTLYAVADALVALKKEPAQVRVVSVGVGQYPTPPASARPKSLIEQIKECVAGFTGLPELLQKTLEVNTTSMDTLRGLLLKSVQTVRINDRFEKPEMATDFMESDLTKLNLLFQQGSESFAKHEEALSAI